jgi:flagellar biosynthesis protein FliQ
VQEPVSGSVPVGQVTRPCSLLLTSVRLVPRLSTMAGSTVQLLHSTHSNNFTFSFIHLLVHKFVTICYTSVFITHHPFTFTYNIFVKLAFTFCKKISYINVCKISQYCYCNCALPASPLNCTIYDLKLPISSWGEGKARERERGGGGKAIPLQPWTGPEGSRRLRFPDFKTVSTCRW